jgi:N-acetylglucosaminyldiphosphoundecaprenol N-acetyl-beta-D-mannosaminyltransferase
MKERQTIDFLGVKIDVIDTKGICERVIEFALGNKPRKVMYVNADCMLISMKDKVYRQILNNADLVYPDGIGVVWGARLWGYRLPGRSTGADFFPHFCKEFAKHHLRLYLLGSREGIAEKAVENLLKIAPDLQIVGTQHGYFKKEATNQIIKSINAAMPHVLVVGLGAPYQEKWIEENSRELDVPVLWGVGGLFDFISGRTWRGPQWLLDHGFEWLCRLIAEPRRLWRRYIIGNAKFVLCLLWYRFIAHRIF